MKAKLILPLLILLSLICNRPLCAQTVVTYAFMPDNPRLGEPVTIGINYGADVKTAALMQEGKRLAKTVFFPMPAGSGPAVNGSAGINQPFMAAVLTVPSTAKAGAAAIVLEGADGYSAEIPVIIGGREFFSDIVELNSALTDMRTVQDAQKTAEANHLWSILNRTGNDAWHLGTFSPPVTSSRRTGFFGDRRVYQYSNGKSDTSIHAGIDYGVPAGTAVNACGWGRVVLARYRIVTGNSIIIEHLPGVYSLYYHLDSMTVAEGDLVSTGALIGLSGATGLATGPHLHWEIRVAGENTDPDAFIARPVLDKNAILGRIYHNRVVQ